MARGGKSASAETPQASAEPVVDAPNQEQSAPAQPEPATATAEAAAASPEEGAADQSPPDPEAKPEQSAPAQPDPEQAEPEAEPVPTGTVTVIVAEAIGGTRDGEPWPAVGQPITLPAAEAAGYLQFGYVREADAE